MGVEFSNVDLCLAAKTPDSTTVPTEEDSKSDSEPESETCDFSVSALAAGKSASLQTIGVVDSITV